MNKTAIKNFSIWARRKLIDDISNKARLVGISEKGINEPLSSSTDRVQFFDVGTKEPYSISGVSISQRDVLVKEIQRRAAEIDHKTAYNNLIEEVAYTWFNRLIAIRFMEVNSYLPSRIRVLSAEVDNKTEPDIVTNPFSADLEYSEDEKSIIQQLKYDNKLDELFRLLFIKQCNALYDNLPELFEKINDYSELLLQISFTDNEGVIYHLVNDIDEDDFNVKKEGQVEIIGWLYQFYNTEPKDETFKLLKNNVKITKERIPSATQLFTPDWIVRYMVENSLGRLWVEGHPNEEIKKNWKYYLEEAEQEEEVQKQLEEIRKEYSKLRPEDIKIIDPSMGSGHVLVYAFDVLMQIYTSQGHTERDAAKLIVENNLFGLDIDKRAYQLAYFAVMMKAKQYNRRILEMSIIPRLYVFEESNGVKRNHLKYFGAGLSDLERNTAKLQIEGLLDTFIDAKEYGSILNVENYDWDLLNRYVSSIDERGQMSVETIGIEETRARIKKLISIGEVMTMKYDVVVTNPPYMGSDNMSTNLYNYCRTYYPSAKSDLYAVFIKKSHKMTCCNRYVSMITQHSWMYLLSYYILRKELFRTDVINMVHLGARAFEDIGGEVVQTTAFIIRKSDNLSYNSTYTRLNDIPNAQDKEREFFSHNYRYITKKSIIPKIPKYNWGYWTSETMIKAFEEGILLEKIVQPRQGLASGNNIRYYRYWQEINITELAKDAESKEEVWDKNRKYVPVNKGGGYRKWYGNNYEVIKFDIQSYSELLQSGNKLPSKDKYFLPGITWSKIASTGFSCRFNDKGFIFTDSGMKIVGELNNLKYIIAFLHSVVAPEFLKLFSETIHYETGNISRLPLKFDNKYYLEILKLVEENIDLAKMDWDSFETSWDFIKHNLILNNSIETAYIKFRQECEDRFSKIRKNEEELNRLFIIIYGLKNELLPDAKHKDITVTRIYDTKNEIPENMKGNIYVLTKKDIIVSFISYAIACMFGRYSLDVEGLTYAGGYWDNSKYKTFIPDKDNVIPITDEEYFKDDIVGLFVTFVKKVYGEETLEKNLSFIADALGNKGDSSREVIRNYFLNDFFKDHVKTYKSRPIYWLFDSGKQNGFKALVYLHRYNEDTIGKLRIDYLHRMQKIYENEIIRMQKTIEESTDSREIAKATKRKEKLIKQLQETREYDEKIIHLALERISLDLDDGVKVNYEKVQTDREGRKHQVLAKI